MKPRAIVPVAVILVVSVGGYWIDQSRSAKESLISGYFESQPTEAASRLGGRVAKILVVEGEKVVAGQPLTILESASYSATYGANKMAAEQAKQQFEETSRGTRPEEIARQEGAVREAQAAYDRVLNGPLPEEIVAAKAKLRAAQFQYRKLNKGSRPEEIQSARAFSNLALQKLKQAQRGLTPEEVAQFKARLDGAAADEDLARKQRNRQEALFQQGAISKRDFDVATATFEQALAHTQDAKQAYKRALEGTPKEELAQASEAYLQASAQLKLVEAGSRKEDIDIAREDVISSDQSLKLLLRGSRPEDIRAAMARLDQAQATLLELQRGNRVETIARTRAASRQAELQAQSVGETLKENTIYATREAQVDRVLVAVGDLVASGSPIIQLGYPDDIWLRVYVPELSLPKVRVGDTAELAIDGIQETIAGRVDSIATTGEFTPANLQSPEERGKQVFAIKIRLASPDRRVKAGMYATVKKVGRWP